MLAQLHRLGSLSNHPRWKPGASWWCIVQGGILGLAKLRPWVPYPAPKRGKMAWGCGPLYLALLVWKNLLKMSYGLVALFCKQARWDSGRQNYWLSILHCLPFQIFTSFIYTSEWNKAALRMGPWLRISGLRMKAKLSNGTLGILLHLLPWCFLSPTCFPHGFWVPLKAGIRKKSDLSHFHGVGRGWSVTWFNPLLLQTWRKPQTWEKNEPAWCLFPFDSPRKPSPLLGLSGHSINVEPLMDHHLQHICMFSLSVIGRWKPLSSVERIPSIPSKWGRRLFWAKGGRARPLSSNLGWLSPRSWE